MQKCRNNAHDNNNSVKFTSSRGNNSTTNDSMVMKIAHAQLHMYTNIMYKFQSSTCKTVSTDRQTDRQPWQFQYTPPQLRWGDIIINFNQPFPKRALVFTCLQYKYFENTAGKGENACIEQFLLFPQCFSTRLKTFLPFSSTLKLLSAKSLSLEESNICHLGKG